MISWQSDESKIFRWTSVDVENAIGLTSFSGGSG